MPDQDEDAPQDEGHGVAARARPAPRVALQRVLNTREPHVVPRYHVVMIGRGTSGYTSGHVTVLDTQLPAWREA